jgi:Fis family transcriptional regulator
MTHGGHAMTDITNTSTPLSEPQSLHTVVKETVEAYLRTIDISNDSNIYEKVLSDIEIPLLTVLLERAEGNQCALTRWLGLSRGTVRKKLKLYGLMDS